MRVPLRLLQSASCTLRSRLGCSLESGSESLRGARCAGNGSWYGRREGELSLGTVQGGARLGGFDPRDDWRLVRFHSQLSTVVLAMPDEEIPVERQGVIGVEIDVANGFENRIGGNAAAGEAAALMEGDDGVAAFPVDADAQLNLRGRGNVVAGHPPAELAEMVIADGEMDESAPTTPDNTAERLEFSASASRIYESAAKRMRMDSPAFEQVDEVKERHIASAWEHWRRLGSPKLHVAPMVDQSELPFRMLCRKYGATAAYTPMLHSRLFAQDHKYRKEFTTCPEDRPLFVQFCANNPDTLLEAGRLVESQCDYVDINLGCPQRIAKRGNYGAFLMENLPLVESLVRNLSFNLKTPVSCKIRLFPDIKDTLAYARMLEDAGCSLLAVHGRTRDQKNGKLVRADWEAIKTVREALRIPVLANGNIRWLEDVESCITATGVEGVMSAESLLENPALFGNYRLASEDCRSQTGRSTNEDQPLGATVDHTQPRTIDERVLCLEYLELCEKYPVPMRMVRGHVHKMLGNFWFKQHPDLREELNKEFKLTLEWLKDMVQRLLARPLPGNGPSLSSLEESEETALAASVPTVEPSVVNTSDSGAVTVSEIAPVAVNLQETVSVK